MPGGRLRSRIHARCCFRRPATRSSTSRSYSPRRRGRRAARRRQSAERARPLSERDRRRVLLPEARARVAAAAGSRSSSCSFRRAARAEEVVPRDAAALVWMANLACLELHPHPVRADDLDHPDELRVDLDPVPGVTWDQIREVARVVRATLADFGLVGWPKTSGSRGMHVYVRIERRWTFAEVRRAALAFAREVERRAPGAGDQQVVEGRAPRRVPRLQPEREGPHHRRRVLHASQTRCAGVRAAPVGRDRRAASRAISRSPRCPGGLPTAAIGTPGSTHASARSSGSSNCRPGRRKKDRAMRRGRRTTRNSRANRPACSRRAGGRRRSRWSRSRGRRKR